MGEPWDIRLGDFTYRIARLNDSTLGISQRVWESLFANQQVPSGKPSVENLRNDDLRWFLDTFSGGEGQAVLKAGDAVGETRYAKSVGIDLSSPGQFTLAKEMAQVGLTGASSTTVQGDTWTDVTGTSTVVGTDRRLDNVGDIIKKGIGSPAAGNWQADFYAKVNPSAPWDASTFTVETGPAPIVSGTHRNMGPGSSVKLTVPQDGTGRVTATFTFLLTTSLETVQVLVRNAADTKTLASGSVVLERSGVGVIGTQSATLHFSATDGVSYLYRVKMPSPNTLYVEFESLLIDTNDDKTAHVSVYNETAATTVASGDVDMQGVTSFQRVATLGFTTNGTDTFSLRYKRSAGKSRSQFVDKGVYTQDSLRTPWNVELGQGNKIWLFDRATGSMPGVFTFDAQNKRWTSIGQVPGTGGTNPQALAHSDYYEYVLLGNGQVWYCRGPSTVTQYTAAFTNPVGLAVGAARLYVLTEDTANGTRLWEIAVDDDASAPIAVPGAAVYTVGGAGSKAKLEPDQTIVRRAVGVQDGCVFYVNHGPVATLYHYTSGGAGAPVTDLPPGFVPRVLSYSLGLVYIGGGFPAVDTDGVTRQRPAIVVVDLAGGSVPVQLDVKLHRDQEDPGSKVQDMQLYGTDLWVMTQVTPAGSKKMRLWRINLTSDGGTFLVQEIVTDESMQTADARAMAVNWRDKVLIWGSGQGAPYVEQDTYITSGTVYLQSSIFNFALTEQKLLVSMAVNGDFPAGTSADLYYSTDDGATWTLAGSRDSPGFVQISDIDASVTFRRLALRCVPRTTNNAVSPAISEFSARAYLIDYAKTWDILLDCRSETATFHVDGRQLRGSELAANLFSLADSGTLVEMADRLSSERPEEEQVYRVVVTNPSAVFLDKGESVVRVKLAER